jgi:hypothetical protein
MTLGRNHHPRAFVRVVLENFDVVEYEVFVARLQAAVNGAFRRYPDAREVEATYVEWSKQDAARQA